MKISYRKTIDNKRIRYHATVFPFSCIIECGGFITIKLHNTQFEFKTYSTIAGAKSYFKKVLTKYMIK